MSDKDNPNDVLVKFTDVTKQYGSLVVLDKLNLEVKKNEMVSIIGPSGSGKTTVLRVLMTLEKINQGVIHLEGEPLTHMDINGNLVEATEKYLRERRSKIGMVFQQFNLFPHLSILDNCTLAPIWVKKMPKKEAEKLALEHLERVQILDQAQKFPGQLSGGQQQRVAIARAIAPNPKILLMDEPFGSLDDDLKNELRDETKKIVKQNKTTCILVTHNMDDALSMSDRIIRLKDGKITEET